MGVKTPKTWISPYGKGHRNKISTNDPHNLRALRKREKRNRKNRSKREDKRHRTIQMILYSAMVILFIYMLTSCSNPPNQESSEIEIVCYYDHGWSYSTIYCDSFIMNSKTKIVYFKKGVGNTVYADEFRIHD